MSTELRGLHATNPLGFMAAVGLQALCGEQELDLGLSWTREVIPRAMVTGAPDVRELAEVAHRAAQAWRTSPALDPSLGGEDLKLKPAQIRRYLDACQSNTPGNTLASVLVAEGSLDRSGKAKPSDLYFTAGQQRFLRVCQEVLDGVGVDDLVQALVGPWRYESTLKSLMWDVTDDANYALAASDPAREKKRTNPGAEVLGLAGLTRFPVFSGPDRTLTTACGGGWKTGGFLRWPIWHHPAGAGAVGSMIQHVPIEEDPPSTVSGWGIARVYECAIRRAEQGGYGSFAPTRIVWSE